MHATCLDCDAACTRDQPSWLARSPPVSAQRDMLAGEVVEPHIELYHSQYSQCLIERIRAVYMRLLEWKSVRVRFILYISLRI